MNKQKTLEPVADEPRETDLIRREPVVSERQAELIDQRNIRFGSLQVPDYRGVIERASEVARELRSIVEQQKLFTMIRGNQHVHCEGWTTLGQFLGLVPRVVSCEESQTTKGEFIAQVEIIRTSDEVVVGRAFASCGPDWTQAKTRQARMSMAQTRATSKAFRLLLSWVMKLAGYAETPAEEMEAEFPPEHENPSQRPNAAKARERLRRATKDELAGIFAEWQTCHRGEGDEFRVWASEVLGESPAALKQSSTWTKEMIDQCHAKLAKERGEPE